MADMPASYERLFREQESHINGLEDQLTSVSVELEKEKSNSAQLREMTEKHTNLLHSFDKLKLLKTKLQKEFTHSKGQLNDLKKYYSIELREADVREKRMLRASSKITDSLHEREKRITNLESRILSLTGEIKQSHARYAHIAREREVKDQIASKENIAFKTEFKTLKTEVEKTHKQAMLKEQELEQTLLENKKLQNKINATTALLSATREEANRAFEARMKALKKKYELAENNVEKHREEQRKTKLMLDKTSNELAMTNTILQTTSKTKTSLFNEKIELKKLLTETVQEMGSKISNLEKGLEHYKLTSTERGNRISLMKNDHEKFANVMTERNRAKEQVLKFKRKLDQTNTRLSSMTQEINFLKDHTKSIIKENHELLVKQQNHKELADELKIALSKQATTKSLLKEKDINNKHELENITIKYSDAVHNLKNAIAGIQEKDRKINELNKSYESMKTKTKQLLTSLGFEGEKGKEALKANYLKMIAEKELGIIPVRDILSGKANFSTGLISIMKDGRVLGQMIEDYGLAAYAQSPQTNEKCCSLYKLFLAKKRLVPNATRDLEPLFKRFTSIASKHLGKTEINNISLGDIEETKNPLIEVIETTIPKTVIETS